MTWDMSIREDDYEVIIDIDNFSFKDYFKHLLVNFYNPDEKD